LLIVAPKKKEIRWQLLSPILGLSFVESKSLVLGRKRMHAHGHVDREKTPVVDLRLDTNAQQFELHVPTEMASVFEKLEGRMRFLGYPCQDIFALKLALDEAASNAFRHGNRRDAAKLVRIALRVTPSEVLVEVEDEGRGFDPERLPDPLAEENLGRPGGRGVFLMRAYCSWVSFNAAGNQVTFCRRRSPA